MIRQTLSSLCIGFGLTFFCFSIFVGLIELGLVTGTIFLIVAIMIAVTPVILSSIWIYKERSKKLYSLKYMAIGILLPVLVFLFLRFTKSIRIILLILISNNDFLPFLLVGCGFFSIGLLGIYFDKKAKSLAQIFITLAILFVSFAPAAVMYKEAYSDFYVPINQRYPIQLSLASLAFLAWGTLAALFTKIKLYEAPKVSSVDMDIESDRNSEPGNTSSINRVKTIGLLLLVIGPLGFIGAAYIYLPNFSMDGNM